MMKLNKSKEDNSKSDGYLTGKLLVANPFLDDGQLTRSVIYVCGHDAHGAIGLIVNKPASDLTLKKLLIQLEIQGAYEMEDTPVYYGGPVEISRGFVLHTTDYKTDSTVSVNADFSVTSTLQVLRALGKKDGPEKFLVCLGYVGWGAAQLDQEIQERGWLIIDGTPGLVFDAYLETKWRTSLMTIGVDPLIFSLESGHA